MKFLIYAFIALSFVSPRIRYFDCGMVMLAMAFALTFVPSLHSKSLDELTNSSLKPTLILIASLFFVLLIFAASFVQFATISSGYYTLRCLRSLIVAVLYAAIVYRIKLKPKDGLVLLANSMLLHSVLVLLQVLDFSGTGMWFRQLNFNSGVEIMQRPRGMGLASGYDVAGLLCAAGFFTSFLLAAWSFAKDIKKAPFWFAASIFCQACTFIASRTGQMAMIFLFCVSLLFFFLRVGGKSIQTFSILALLTSLAALIAGYGALDLFFPGIRGNLEYSGFELYRNILSGRGFYTASSNDTLTNHYRIPLDALSILFGSGNSLFRRDGFLVSDVGWVQITVAHGAAGILASVSLCVSFLGMAFFTKARDLEQILVKFCCICLGIVIVLASFKGPYIFGRQVFDILIFSFIVLTLASNKGAANHGKTH